MIRAYAGQASIYDSCHCFLASVIAALPFQIELKLAVSLNAHNIACDQTSQWPSVSQLSLQLDNNASDMETATSLANKQGISMEGKASSSA